MKEINIKVHPEFFWKVLQRIDKFSLSVPLKKKVDPRLAGQIIEGDVKFNIYLYVEPWHTKKIE